MSASGGQLSNAILSRVMVETLRDRRLLHGQRQSGPVAEDNAHLAEILIRDGQVPGERLVVEVNGQRVVESTAQGSISARSVSALREFAELHFKVAVKR